MRTMISTVTLLLGSSLSPASSDAAGDVCNGARAWLGQILEILLLFINNRQPLTTFGFSSSLHTARGTSFLL